MSKIIFNDGTEIQDGIIYKSAWEDQIICEIPGNNIVNAAIIFGNSEKTRKMEYYNGVFKNTFENFTNLLDISYLNNKDMTQIVLTGENTNVEKSYTLPDEYIPGALAEEIFSNQREEQQNNEH